MLFTRLIPKGAFASEVGAFILEGGNLLYDAIVQVIKDQLPLIGKDGGVVNSVNTRSGDVVLTKEDVGLGSVADIPPTDMPVSTLQKAAIDRCFDVDDLIPQANVQGLVADLADRIKTINGNPPDYQGDVQIAGIDISALIPRPPVEPPDSFLWYDGTAYYLINVPDYVVGPDPATLVDGDTLRWDAAAESWVVAKEITASGVTLTSPNGKKWELSVGDDGTLSAKAQA